MIVINEMKMPLIGIICLSGTGDGAVMNLMLWFMQRYFSAPDRYEIGYTEENKFILTHNTRIMNES